MIDLQSCAEDDFCYLTTTGRVSGQPHTIEIWFALHGETLYMLAGGRAKADWVKNIQRHNQTFVRSCLPFLKSLNCAGEGLYI